MSQARFLRTRGPSPGMIAGRLPATLSQAQQGNGADLLAAARRAAHIVSGRTQGSLRVVPVGALGFQLVGNYGAKWEVQRGGEHDWARQAFEASAPRFQGRVQDALQEATH